MIKYVKHPDVQIAQKKPLHHFFHWFNQQTTMEHQQQNDYSQDGLTNRSKNLVKPTPFNRNKLFPCGKDAESQALLATLFARQWRIFGCQNYVNNV